MRCYLSRSEERELNLYQAAREGNFGFKDILYPTEMTSLENRRDLKIYDVKPFPESKGLFYSTIDWSRAFEDGIPLIVFHYIIGITDYYPKENIKTFAQELYVIAARENHRKKK